MRKILFRALWLKWAAKQYRSGEAWGPAICRRAFRNHYFSGVPGSLRPPDQGYRNLTLVLGVLCNSPSGPDRTGLILGLTRC